MTFLGGASLALGSALEQLLSPITEVVISGFYVKSTFSVWLRNGSLFLSKVREENSSKWCGFFCFVLFFVVSLWGTHFFFYLSDFLQIPNNHRMIDVELFGNFLCSCKRISFDDCSYLVFVNFWWPAITLLIFKALISLAKLLEPPLHCSSWAKCIVDVLNCTCCFMAQTHFELELKKLLKLAFCLTAFL